MKLICVVVLSIMLATSPAGAVNCDRVDETVDSTEDWPLTGPCPWCGVSGSNWDTWWEGHTYRCVPHGFLDCDTGCVSHCFRDWEAYFCNACPEPSPVITLHDERNCNVCPDDPGWPTYRGG